MAETIVDIFLVSIMVLCTVVFAGVAAVVLFMIIDFISDTIREWKRRNDDA